MFYNQLNGEGIAVCASDVFSKIEDDQMIEAPDYEIAISRLGMKYQDGKWVAGPLPVSAPRHISVGAFYDRFGTAKWGILASADPGVTAVIKDASVRKFIDLDNPALPMGIATIQAAGFEIDGTTIIDAPVQPGEEA